MGVRSSHFRPPLASGRVWNDPLEREPAKQIIEPLAFTKINGMVRGDQLREQLCELPKFDERGRRVVAEVALR